MVVSSIGVIWSVLSRESFLPLGLGRTLHGPLPFLGLFYQAEQELTFLRAQCLSLSIFLSNLHEHRLFLRQGNVRLDNRSDKLLHRPPLTQLRRTRPPSHFQ